MGAKNVKLIIVPANGQISIGTAWAGKQIRVEEVNDNEIHIMSGARFLSLMSGKKINPQKQLTQRHSSPA